MRLLVCGGRKYDNRMYLYAILNRLNPTVVIQGGASGADRLAAEWAEHYNVKCETFNAEWEKHGKSAGPKRNQRMLDEGKPDLVLAFPGGRGTADMVSRAVAARVLVLEVRHWI